MKRTFLLCTIALSVLLMGGCTRQNNQPQENSSTPGSTASSTETSQSMGTSQSISTSPSDATQNSNNEKTMISEERAREIALNHAGLTADQVTFIQSHLDKDDGRLNYDVEFYTSDHKEYDYEIDPYTGEILDTDFDAEYYPDTPNPSDHSQATTDTSTTDVKGQ